MEEKSQCLSCSAEVLVSRFTCPICGEKIYRRSMEEEKANKTKEQTQEDLIRFNVIPKESLASAMRTGTLKAFMRSKPAEMNKISFADLEEQSGVAQDVWLLWAKKKMQVSRAEVNEIISNIRHYEATVMLEKLRNSWEAPSYGFPAKTRAEREKEKWKALMEYVLKAERPLPSVNCGLCKGCETKWELNVEVLHCPNFALQEAA